LKDININQCKLLTDRFALLKALPTSAVVAELGVDRGEFSEQILKICQPTKLHLVDSWSSKRYNNDLKKGVEVKFAQQIKSRQVELNIGLSVEWASKFKERYFDWIYIDTDHGYKVTIAELYAYEPKIKDGGYICGHDYIIGNWDGRVKYGVIDAVYEFCEKRNWELAYLTCEHGGGQHPSFCIKKI